MYYLLPKCPNYMCVIIMMSYSFLLIVNVCFVITVQLLIVVVLYCTLYRHLINYFGVAG